MLIRDWSTISVDLCRQVVKHRSSRGLEKSRHGQRNFFGPSRARKNQFCWARNASPSSKATTKATPFQFSMFHVGIISAETKGQVGMSTSSGHAGWAHPWRRAHPWWSVRARKISREHKHCHLYHMHLFFSNVESKFWVKRFLLLINSLVGFPLLIWFTSNATSWLRATMFVITTV